MVETIYRRQDKREMLLQIWSRRLRMLAAALALAGLLFLGCLMQEMPEDVIVEGNYLRTDLEEDQVTFGVEARTEDGMARDDITLELGGEEEPGETEDAEPDSREVLLAEIEEAVEEAVSEGKEAAAGGRIRLPGSVSGKEICYRNPEHRRDFSSFYLILAAMLLIPLFWRQQRVRQLQERDRQMMMDYPEFVNKTMLLLSAGLTVRGCFERISGEYKHRLEKGGERRYVYEEVSFSCQEMKNGVSEQRVIEEFGKRCRLIPYLRFSSLLGQNLRKGSEGLIELLGAEAMDAFEKRREQVKVLGETAGTKLLLPMILMLGVVMAIIIVPAFMTM